MKIAFLELSLALALGLMVTGQDLRAQSETRVPTAGTNVLPAKTVENEITRLIHEDAKAIALSNSPKPSPLAKTSPADVLTMSPYIVRSKKAPTVPFFREDPLARFFRTGTILENVGEKITTKL